VTGPAARGQPLRLRSGQAWAAVPTQGLSGAPQESRFPSTWLRAGFVARPYMGVLVATRNCRAVLSGADFLLAGCFEEQGQNKQNYSRARRH
jgi:hypothetical protein